MNRLFAGDHPWREPEIRPQPDAPLQIVHRDDAASDTRGSDEARLAPAAQDATSFSFRAVPHEEAMIAVLDQRATDLLPSEAFRRKEHELGALFVFLTPADSVELERRLSLSSAGDVLASRFARLTPERRARLIAFLRHARHRAMASRSKGSR